MKGQILVPLKRRDPVEEILPYLRNISRPGMNVVFLIPYPVDLWAWWRDHWVAVESPREAILAGKGILQDYGWAKQKEVAQNKTFPAREVLAQYDIEVVVELYTGSLRRVVADYVAQGEVHWVVVRVGDGWLRMRRLFRRAMMLLGSFRWTRPAPVLLFYQGSTD